MNIWVQLAIKAGEKLLANQLKHNVWNNPRTTYQQKLAASNLIDCASLAKDIYDLIRIVEESENNISQGGKR